MRFPGVFLAALCAFALLTGCATAPAAEGDAQEQTIGTLPTFQASDIDGGLFDFSEHLGKKAVLMSFWAMYCEPCKTEMPFLQELHDKYGDKGLLILSVSMDGPDTIAGVAPYMHSNDYTFSCVLDEDSAITQAFNPGVEIGSAGFS